MVERTGRLMAGQIWIVFQTLDVNPGMDCLVGS